MNGIEDGDGSNGDQRSQNVRYPVRDFQDVAIIVANDSMQSRLLLETIAAALKEKMNCVVDKPVRERVLLWPGT